MKHYKNYTVGELIEAGFKVNVTAYDSTSKEEAEQVVEVFGGDLTTGEHQYDGTKWMKKKDHNELFEVNAFYEKSILKEVR